MGLKKLVATAYLALSKWTMVSEPLPDKVIIIGAPHTSNWDGVFMAVSLWKAGREFQFLVKDSLVKAPILGPFIRSIGGVAVERNHANGMVGAITQRIRASNSFTLCLTPKGTRSPRDYWKSGFYRIALEANVPLQFGFVDSATKTFGWGPTYTLTGDMKTDMDVIRSFYAGKVGFNPEKTSVPRLRGEKE
ncbi:1-acyl-sn-glycerol-3-phosphate acyltransferase [Schaalia vaccimaxillae]|uniref:1-acyl-sn-glycerol-3-phosphate acyltransferase n=1 Tax=Schaalia vaccimaxillae TaxID=183916 RepID=UPI0003B5000E|nr:1-acyl-sn-glycerol-3-phosphate acyltransferase [Schaalia vaccimaxillae]